MLPSFGFVEIWSIPKSKYAIHARNMVVHAILWKRCDSCGRICGAYRCVVIGYQMAERYIRNYEREQIGLQEKRWQMGSQI